MLNHTFHHLPGIGASTERRLWEAGITDWDRFTAPYPLQLSAEKGALLTGLLQESRRQLENSNPGFFAKRLPASLHWRLFPAFRPAAVYLDIETTGLDRQHDQITTIALYDGRAVSWFVNGRNLDDFPAALERYSIIISYNGKSFDVPVIEKHFGLHLPQAHIDLRYILAALGFRGGLKGCERALGMGRGDLDGVDGYFAVLLWKDYIQNNNPRALETLLAYNIQDVISLEPLMVTAYNLNLRGTPFAEGQLPLPEPPRPSLQPCRKTIAKIIRAHYPLGRVI
ncbi:ribonuclease H-like domain-containing protein [Thermodesulfobacteriota bacterium]